VAQVAPVKAILLDQSAGEQLFLGREREPTLIKVDAATAGAREMFAMLRVLDPGSSLGLHRHRDDELIFIHAGDVTATLAGRDQPARAGATIFVPGDAWMDIRNTGTTPATLLIVFAAPHMAEYIRSLGTRPGEPKRDLTLEILRPLAAKHGITFQTP
jgi:quercetin dioxygenase-like cupin family protein